MTNQTYHKLTKKKILTRTKFFNMKYFNLKLGKRTEMKKTACPGDNNLSRFFYICNAQRRGG